MNPFAPNEGAPGFNVPFPGVRVRFEWSFLIVSALIGYSGAITYDPFGNLDLGATAVGIAVWIGVVTVSILVHELGHAGAMRLFNVRSHIVLHAMGGVTVGEGVVATRPRRVFVSVAGSLTELLLLGLPALWLATTWQDPGPTADRIVEALVWVNIAWALVNLLPVLPLDGGNIAKEVLDALTKGKGEVPARWMSIAVTGAGALWALRTGRLFLGLFALFLLSLNWRPLADRRKSARIEEVRRAYAALREDDGPAALELASAVVPRAKSAPVRAAAIEATAWAHLMADDDAGALTALARLPEGEAPSGHLSAVCLLADPAERVNTTVDAWLDTRKFVPPPVYVRRLERDGLLDQVADRMVATRAPGASQGRLILQHLLFETGRFDQSARVGEGRVAGAAADPEGAPELGVTAYNVACAHARMGRVDDALTWLERSHTEFGYGDVAQMEADEDLASLRADPRFVALAARISAGPDGDADADRETEIEQDDAARDSPPPT